MNDMISRAALLKECAECQKTDPHFEERGWASHFINDAGEPSTEWYCVEDLIENAPTVEAIPVEWMNKKRDSETLALFSNIYGRGDKDIVHSIHKVLELWRKEQDEQNG